MKKAINNIILTVVFAGLLSGCGSGASDVIQDVSEADSQEISGDAEDILDPFAVLDLSVKDNSLDVYSAAGRAALQPEKPENALEGSGIEESVLGATGAYHFKKHIFSSAAECWDEVLFVTGEGKAGSERYEVKDQLWGIGPVVGTNNYVTFSAKLQEDGEPRYLLTVRDENHEYLRELPLDFLSGEEGEVITGLSDFLVDQSGRIHMVQSKYILASQEGEILEEYTPDNGYIKRLAPLYDGRIAFEIKGDGKDGGMLLQYIDEETHNPVTLATLKKEAFCLTLFDEDTLLYADREGLYRSGLSGENPEMIYRWSNHGVIIHGVSALQADEEGRIKLIYSDSENGNYLCLEPTTEEMAVCEITMGVGPDDMNFYKWVVAEFNKRYPTCHIELVEYTYEDKTALLTQLTAGKGPVLLDSSMLGFEELEELWEPLDTVMEQLGLTEKLLPTAMEMGKINGTLYGVVKNFWLETVVASPDLKDWDYDTFFQCIQDRPELEAICDYYGGNGMNDLFRLLIHGLDDNYFIIPDEETGEMYFDSERLRQVMDLVEKYCIAEEVEPGNSLLEGKTLCNVLTIRTPEEAAEYRLIYGEDANYIGYPAKDGGMHYMFPFGMLSIRRTATKEEKEAAAAFLALHLSYEGQIHAAKAHTFQLSVRRDVLEEQIASASMGSQMNIPGEVSVGSNVDIEKDGAMLLDLIDRAKPYKTFPRELWNILYEEEDLYLSGSITKDILIDHLENRIGLYLEEKK